MLHGGPRPGSWTRDRLAYLIAAWVSGNPVRPEMFAIMVLFTGGLVLAAQRSETITGLGRARRADRIDRPKATAIAVFMSRSQRVQYLV